MKHDIDVHLRKRMVIELEVPATLTDVEIRDTVKVALEAKAEAKRVVSLGRSFDGWYHGE